MGISQLKIPSSNIQCEIFLFLSHILPSKFQNIIFRMEQDNYTHNIRILSINLDIRAYMNFSDWT